MVYCHVIGAAFCVAGAAEGGELLDRGADLICVLNGSAFFLPRDGFYGFWRCLLA
jgi:hypothetical protein